MNQKFEETINRIEERVKSEEKRLEESRSSEYYYSRYIPEEDKELQEFLLNSADGIFDEIISKKEENEDLTTFYANIFQQLNKAERKIKDRYFKDSSGMVDAKLQLFYEIKNKISTEFMKDVVNNKIDSDRVSYEYIYSYTNEQPTVYWDHLRIFIDDNKRFTILPPVMIEENPILYYNFCDHERNQIFFIDQMTDYNIEEGFQDYDDGEIGSYDWDEDLFWEKINEYMEYDDICAVKYLINRYLPKRDEINEFLQKCDIQKYDFLEMIPVEYMDKDIIEMLLENGVKIDINRIPEEIREKSQKNKISQSSKNQETHSLEEVSELVSDIEANKYYETLQTLVDKKERENIIEESEEVK